MLGESRRLNRKAIVSRKMLSLGVGFKVSV